MDQNEQMMQLLMMMNPELGQMMQLLNGLNQSAAPAEKPKKKITAYQRRYKKAFRSIEKRYKLKSGKWKKGGFKSAVREAHRLAKKKGGKK